MREDKIVLTKTQQMVLAGLFTAVGLLLPYITGHAIGVPGTVLLPMHLPILLCGFICGPRYGAICGILTPILSSLLTGMPPLFPKLPAMACELLFYGLCSGYLYQTRRKKICTSLGISMVVGRIVSAIVMSSILTLQTGALKLAAAGTDLITGIPGIIIQFVLIPPVVKMVLSYYGNGKSVTAVPVLEQAVEQIRSKQTSCVVIQHNQIVHTACGQGVGPLLDVYRQNPQLLQDALVVDKVIGKAAAMILVLGGVCSVHGLLVSDAAVQYLNQRNIQVSYDKRVVSIHNRSHSGMCPIEASVINTDDPKVGYEILAQTIRALQKSAV